MSAIDPILFPNPVAPGGIEKTRDTGSASRGQDSGRQFSSILDEKATEIRFSNHAQERLRSRNINLDENALLKLRNAVDSVAQKGGKESLVMMGDSALLVSVVNRTVVTALDKAQMQGNVFTNIDSAVII